MGTVAELNSYPVKGLSARSLDRVELRVGEGFPQDRIFGLARADSDFDPANPRPLPKHQFLVLAQVEKLARLKTTYDPATRQLGLDDGEGGIMHFDLEEQSGKDALADHIAAFLDLPASEKPKVAEAHPHRFTDVSVISTEMMNAVSLINLESVRQFQQDIGSEVNPARFRGNLLIDNFRAFSELDLVGRTVQAGEVRFEVTMRTKRCPATEVNPVTSERDLKTPHLLKKEYGHFDMGVYLVAKSSGTSCLGDAFTII